MRVLADGTVLDGAPGTGGFPVGLADSSSKTMVGYGGGLFLVCWDLASSHVVCKRVGVDGTLPDGSATAAPTSVDDGWVLAPHPAFDGTSFLVVADTSGPEPKSIWGRRVRASDGELVDAVPFISLLGGEEPALASGASGPLLVWSSPDSANVEYVGEVRASRVRTSDGVLVDAPGVVVSRSDNAEWRAAITSGPSDDYFVVWEDARDTRYTASSGNIYGARIDGAAGVSRDPVAIPITTAPGLHQNASVAFDGVHYVVTWESSDGSVRVARVRASDGTLLDGPPQSDGIAVGRLQGPPSGLTHSRSIACDLLHCLVIWSGGASATRFDVNTARALDPGLLLFDPPPTSAGITTDAANFIVVAETAGGVYAKRIRSSDGASLDGSPSETGIEINSAPGSALPAVAFDGSQYLIVWQSNGTTATIHGARVTAAGKVLDGPPSGSGIAIAADQYTSLGSPDVAFNGKSFVVGFTAPTAIKAVRVSTAGVVLGTPLTISGGQIFRQDVAVASGAKGRAFVAYSQTRAPADVEERVYIRALDDELGGACGATTDCETGWCVDGVCCDSSCGAGATDDCLACSQSAGGARDGVCGPALSTHVCRSSQATCEMPAMCDGTTPACPANAIAADGTPCSGGTCASGACLPSADGSVQTEAGTPEAAPPPDGAVQDDAEAGVARGADASNDTVAGGGGCDCRSAGVPADGAFGFGIALLGAASRRWRRASSSLSRR